MDNKIIDELETTYSEEFNNVAGDLGTLEEAVKANPTSAVRGKIEIYEIFLQ